MSVNTGFYRKPTKTPSSVVKNPPPLQIAGNLLCLFFIHDPEHGDQTNLKEQRSKQQEEPDEFLLQTRREKNSALPLISPGYKQPVRTGGPPRSLSWLSRRPHLELKLAAALRMPAVVVVVPICLLDAGRCNHGSRSFIYPFLARFQRNRTVRTVSPQLFTFCL